jgi:hypothetical protein
MTVLCTNRVDNLGRVIFFYVTSALTALTPTVHHLAHLRKGSVGVFVHHGYLTLLLTGRLKRNSAARQITTL